MNAGELREALADIPDAAEVYACGPDQCVAISETELQEDEFILVLAEPE